MRRWSYDATPIILLAVCALATRRASAGRNSLLSQAPPEHKKLFAVVKPIILGEARKPPHRLGDTDESYFWRMSPRLTDAILAYRYSKEPAFLEAFVALMGKVLMQRYVHPTRPEWRGWFHYRKSGGNYMLIHAALIRK